MWCHQGKYKWRNCVIFSFFSRRRVWLNQSKARFTDPYFMSDWKGSKSIKFTMRSHFHVERWSSLNNQTVRWLIAFSPLDAISSLAFLNRDQRSLWGFAERKFMLHEAYERCRPKWAIIGEVFQLENPFYVTWLVLFFTTLSRNSRRKSFLHFKFYDFIVQLTDSSDFDESPFASHFLHSSECLLKAFSIQGLHHYFSSAATREVLS